MELPTQKARQSAFVTAVCMQAVCVCTGVYTYLALFYEKESLVHSVHADSMCTPLFSPI